MDAVAKKKSFLLSKEQASQTPATWENVPDKAWYFFEITDIDEKQYTDQETGRHWTAYILTFKRLGDDVVQDPTTKRFKIVDNFKSCRRTFRGFVNGNIYNRGNLSMLGKLIEAVEGKDIDTIADIQSGTYDLGVLVGKRLAAYVENKMQTDSKGVEVTYQNPVDFNSLSKHIGIITVQKQNVEVDVNGEAKE